MTSETFGYAVFLLIIGWAIWGDHWPWDVYEPTSTPIPPPCLNPDYCGTGDANTLCVNCDKAVAALAARESPHV